MTRFELLADAAAETINGGIDDINVDLRFKSVRARLSQRALNSSVVVGSGLASSNLNQSGSQMILA